jgi:uroporphyrinogen III methyltransferase/synthase
VSGAPPLEGKCIVVTRPERRARSLAEALRSLGARVIEAPAIRIEPPSDAGPLENALDRIRSSEYDFVAFTSANAVEIFFERLSERIPSSLRFAVVGKATAASLEERGLVAHVIPERFTAEETFRALEAVESLSGKRFLLPRADIARPTLAELLESRGAVVDSVEAYRTVPDPEGVRRACELVVDGEVDVVTFTSASTVTSFFAGLEEIDPGGGARSRFAAASIGPVTSSALRRLGVEPSLEAEPSTTAGLVGAIVRFLRPRRETC